VIGRIRGQLILKRAPEILVEVGGIGYELQVPMTTFFQLPETGAELSLVTHFVVREDAQILYGFIDEADRRLFRQLIRVSGVGPKLALAILSGMDAQAFARCVQRADVAPLVALPGVGKKTAERLLVEMRDKMQQWPVDGGRSVPGVPPATDVPAADVVGDAESALVALGYKPQEASRLIARVHDDGVRDSEELIRRALKSVAAV